MSQRRGVFPCPRGHASCRDAARQEKWCCGEGACKGLHSKPRGEGFPQLSQRLIVKPLQGARPSTTTTMKETTENVSLDDASWRQVMCESRAVSGSRGEWGGARGAQQLSLSLCLSLSLSRSAGPGLGEAGRHPAQQAGTASGPRAPPAPKQGAESIHIPHGSTLGTGLVPCKPCSGATMVELREGERASEQILDWLSQKSLQSGSPHLLRSICF